MVEFRVLQCAHCVTFQVLQVTKSPKWKCKLCGEKQSVLKEYGRGSGADCRRHVQKLNTLRMERDNATENIRLASVADDSNYVDPIMGQMEGDCVSKQGRNSRWEAFMEKEDREDDESQESSKDNVRFAFAETNEEDISITTDWSAFENEHRQSWKNKRKTQHNRSKWSKATRYDNDDENACFSFDATNENIYDNGHNSTVKHLSKCGKGEAGFTTHSKRGFISSHRKSHDQFSVSSPGTKHNLILRSEMNLESRVSTTTTTTTTTASSVMTNKSNQFKLTSSSAQTHLRGNASKWNGFLTEKKNEEEDSNEGSDDDNNSERYFTNKYSSDVVCDSSNPLHMPRLDQNFGASIPISKWDTFVTEKDSDNSEGPGAEIESYNENFCKSENFNRHQSNNDMSQKRRVVAENSVPKSLNDASQSIDKESSNLPKFKQSFPLYKDDAPHHLTNKQELLIANKSSLFQLGDEEDAEAWDLDL